MSDPLVAQILRHYELSRGMVAALAADFTEEEASTAAGRLKPLNWYLGHVMVPEAGLLRMFSGQSVEPPASSTNSSVAVPVAFPTAKERRRRRI
jgi:hypothetical protein